MSADSMLASLIATVVGATVFLSRDNAYAATVASVVGCADRPCGRIVYQYPAAGTNRQCGSASHDSAACLYGRCGLHDSARDLALRMLLDFWHDHADAAPDRSQRVHVAGNRALVYRRRSDNKLVRYDAWRDRSS